jgi:hypothetical protein
MVQSNEESCISTNKTGVCCDPSPLGFLYLYFILPASLTNPITIFYPIYYRTDFVTIFFPSALHSLRHPCPRDSRLKLFTERLTRVRLFAAFFMCHATLGNSSCNFMHRTVPRLFSLTQFSFSLTIYFQVVERPPVCWQEAPVPLRPS